MLVKLYSSPSLNYDITWSSLTSWSLVLNPLGLDFQNSPTMGNPIRIREYYSTIKNKLLILSTTLRCLTLRGEASIRRPHTIQFHAYNVLRKAKLRHRKPEQSFLGTEWEGSGRYKAGWGGTGSHGAALYLSVVHLLGLTELYTKKH